MKDNIPTNEIKAVITWMKDLMYGKEPTTWAYGNEHDRMFDAVCLLTALIPEEEDRP